ncbi:hypothetical protein BGZ76_005726, partial [Entomortierella beljakovae]
MSTLGDEDSNMDLFYFVNGKTPLDALGVSISRTMRVDGLRRLLNKLLKKQESDPLPLYIVSIPTNKREQAVEVIVENETTKIVFKSDSTLDSKRLDPRALISDIFPNGPGDDTYILVDLPQQGPATSSTSSTS